MRGMGLWDFASKAEDDHSQEMVTALQENDANGALSGTVTFRKRVFSVTGQWAAKGSVPGRNASVFWFGGSTSDAAPCFLVASGDLDNSTSPATMAITVTTANAGDGDDWGYNGILYQLDQPDQPDDPFGM
jgi:hypothetical protein